MWDPVPGSHVDCRVERIDLICFLAGCYKRWINQALSMLCFRFLLSVPFVQLLCWLFIFYCVAGCSFCFVCLFVYWITVLVSCQYLSSDWLKRLLWGTSSESRLSPQRPSWRLCYILLVSYLVVSPAPPPHKPLKPTLAWYTLFVPHQPATHWQCTHCLRCIFGDKTGRCRHSHLHSENQHRPVAAMLWPV